MTEEDRSLTIDLSADERRALEQAAQASPRVRHWRRYRAILLLASGQPPRAVAAALGASLASIYNWAAAWRQGRLDALVEPPHGGRHRCFDASGERWLDTVLASDPQACGYATAGWTVPLLVQEAARAGYAVSAHTLRRSIRRLGWRWKRPKYVLGRPDPADAEKRGR